MDVVVPTTRVHCVALIKENMPTMYSHDLTIKYFILTIIIGLNMSSLQITNYAPHLNIVSQTICLGTSKLPADQMGCYLDISNALIWKFWPVVFFMLWLVMIKTHQTGGWRDMAGCTSCRKTALITLGKDITKQNRLWGAFWTIFSLLSVSAPWK